MLHYVGKGHSFLIIDNKNSPEKIFQLGVRLLELILFAESSDETEVRIGTSSLNFSFHVMT